MALRRPARLRLQQLLPSSPYLLSAASALQTFQLFSNQPSLTTVLGGRTSLNDLRLLYLSPSLSLHPGRDLLSQSFLANRICEVQIPALITDSGRVMQFIPTPTMTNKDLLALSAHLDNNDAEAQRRGRKKNKEEGRGFVYGDWR